MTGQRTRQRTVGERGAAAVEFAIILPLLCALALGIFEFGRGYFVKIQLTGAVREGARDLALGKSGPVAQQTVKDSAPGVLPGSDITFSGVQECPPGSAGRGTITASFPFKANVYFFQIDKTITVTGDMRCGV